MDPTGRAYVNGANVGLRLRRILEAQWAKVRQAARSVLAAYARFAAFWDGVWEGLFNPDVADRMIDHYGKNDAPEVPVAGEPEKPAVLFARERLSRKLW